MNMATQEGVAPPQTEERKAAYKEAAVELGKGIALGLVPFLGQAIDVYDTIESSISLYNAKKDDDKENAQFDLILAIVGWVPGPGDGVKKSLRLVNKNPDRFAPVLFDLLRFVLQECGIRTSPEALLEEIFNAGKLKAQLKDITDAIVESSTFEALPQGAQHAVKSTMNVAMASLPMMVLVVEKRIKKWSKKQHNSSAQAGSGTRAVAPQPGSRQGAGTEGKTRAAGGGAGDGVRSQAATVALSELTNELLGISGEHIADYMCVEKFRWGTWTKHDQGADGAFKPTPGKDVAGKLSKGGSPKQAHKLYKLSDGANGTGIDAVWRATSNNGSKPYAIVEAKASRDEDAPKFHRQLSLRKPSIKSTLGANVISNPVELIEPLDPADEDASGAAKASGGKKAGGKRRSGAPASSASTSSTDKTAKRITKVRVQMSPKWIEENLDRAVERAIASDIRRKGYQRHLFYSPAYHLSGSPKAHMLAKHSNAGPDAHGAHDAFHYGEAEVGNAVTARMRALKKKYGAIDGLEGVK